MTNESKERNTPDQVEKYLEKIFGKTAILQHGYLPLIRKLAQDGIINEREVTRMAQILAPLINHEVNIV